MTTTTAARIPVPTHPSRSVAERRLRTVLAINALTSVTSGLAATVAPDRVADVLGVDGTGWVRVVGLGLVLFAVDVALVARSRRTVLRPGALAVSMADVAWVGATAAVITAGWLSGSGPTVAILLGVAVADLGILQLWYRHRLPTGDGTDRRTLTT